MASGTKAQQAAMLAAQAGQSMARGLAGDAETLMLQAVRLTPRDAALWSNLATIAAAQRRHDDAAQRFRKALSLQPGLAAAESGLGRVLLALGKLDAAERHCRRALAGDPQGAVAHKNLGDVLLRQGRCVTAIAHLQTALRLQPHWVAGLNSLAMALKLAGRAAEAVEACHRSMALQPNDTAARNLVLALTYTECGAEDLFAAQTAWARFAAPKTADPAEFSNDADPQRPLTIGYLSADFRTHPVADNVAGLLAHHDRARFRVHAYAHLAGEGDAMTAQLRRSVDLWRPIAQLSDQQAAAQIRADGVDILVSLAGWTGENRPRICALRPAPVQISFYDVGSSGLAHMDAWLTDDLLHPPGSGEIFTERLVRLPVLYLENIPSDAPEVGEVPGGTDRPITFASFNNPVKITDRTLDLWAGVLKAVPDSRLWLRYRGMMQAEGPGEGIVGRLGARGVAPERLLLEDRKLPRADHLGLYSRVDIALDTYPFNGSTTTYEALFMGVPVISRVGERFVSRVGLSLLAALGLEDLAAADDASFIATAAALAADRRKLADLRAGLRGRILASKLVDAPAYARAFEAEMRMVWQDWCARKRG